MADLSVKYMGLNLKNPLIAGCSGLTQSFEDFQKLEENGIAAITMRSLFEEQIYIDAEFQRSNLHEHKLNHLQYFETVDYIEKRVRREYLSNFVKTISDAKKKLHIPIISSINCMSASGWTSFASKLQDAGADAIELNIAIQSFNSLLSAADIEDLHLEIIGKVCASVSIPVAVKLSPYFADLCCVIDKIASTGVSGIILFNRFISPDINTEKMQVTSTSKFSTPAELPNTLRWIAMKSGSTTCDLCASTGIHTGNDVIKILLAGGAAAQIVSTLYQNGLGHIAKMLNEIETWMKGKGYTDISQFVGKMRYIETETPASYERTQFLNYYSLKEPTKQ